MDFSAILTFLQNLNPIVHVVIVVLGMIVVVGTAVDKLTPDGGKFTDKIMAIPILGQLLKALAAFSPFNTK
jgi:hypothetical protein